MEPYRPSVSRETRLLLAIVLVSLSMLWVLARIRFPDRPATPNPVPPVLAQLAPPSALQDIAATITQLTPRIQGLVAPVAIHAQNQGDGGSSQVAIVPGVRVRDDLVLAIVGRKAIGRTITGSPVEMASRDPVSGVSLFRVPGTAPVLDTWLWPAQPYPRYLIDCEASASGISLRPVFIGAFDSLDSPFWPGRIWMIRSGEPMRPGAVLFTSSGELAGMAIEHRGALAVVPAAVLMTTLDRLDKRPHGEPGWIGVDVQALAPDLAAALHATAGTIVTWVDPQGPAALLLAPTDVIEEVDGKPVANEDQWDAQVLALTDGQVTALSVRRGGERQEVRITAAREPPPAPPRGLGLTLRTIPRQGAEVIRVDGDGAGARAGIQPGDLITYAGDLSFPSASQVSRAFAAAGEGGMLIVAVTRGQSHRVVSIRKQP